jgi:hypothetical protein
MADLLPIAWYGPATSSTTTVYLSDCPPGSHPTIDGGTHIGQGGKALRSIGAPGFEPGTFWSQTRRATGLRYAPLYLRLHNLTPRGPPSKRPSVHETVHGSRLALPQLGPA